MWLGTLEGNVFYDTDNDGVIDDANGDGLVARANIDNYPFGWVDGGVKDTEDIKRAGGNPYSLTPAMRCWHCDSAGA